MSVNITTLICVYVTLPLAGLLCLWLYDEWTFRRSRKVATTQEMITCEICLHQFFAREGEILPRCPQCGSLNKRPAA